MPGNSPIGSSPVGSNGGTTATVGQPYLPITDIAYYANDQYPSGEMKPAWLCIETVVSAPVHTVEVCEEIALASDTTDPTSFPPCEIATAVDSMVVSWWQIADDLGTFFDYSAYPWAEALWSALPESVTVIAANATATSTALEDPVPFTTESIATATDFVDPSEDLVLSSAAIANDWFTCGTDATITCTSLARDYTTIEIPPVTVESVATATDLSDIREDLLVDDATATATVSFAVTSLLDDVTNAYSSTHPLAFQDAEDTALAYSWSQEHTAAVTEAMADADNLLVVTPVAWLDSAAAGDEAVFEDKFTYPPNEATALPWSSTSVGREWVFDPTFGQIGGSMSSGGANKVLELGPVSTDCDISFWYHQPMDGVLSYEVVGVSAPVVLHTPYMWSQVTVPAPEGAVLAITTNSATSLSSYIDGVIPDEGGVISSSARATATTISSLVVVGEAAATADSTPIEAGIVVASDVATAEAAATPGSYSNATLTNAAAAASEGFVTDDPTAVDVVTCSEVTEVTILNALVIDHALVDATFIPSTTVGLQPQVSTAAGSELVTASIVTVYSSEGSAGDTVAVSDAPVTVSVADASDIGTANVVSAWTLDDAAAVSEAMFLNGVFNDSSESLGLADDKALFSRPDLTAWVMNTETGAVNWYSNWGFTDIVTSKTGNVYAVGPEGLALLGGSLDDGDPIESMVVFDRTDFGGYDRNGHPTPDEQKKRIEGLYFGYRATGALRATVESWGPKYGAYSYTMPASSAEPYRNGRVVLGKGLVSRYWKISISNTNGCNFAVTSISADIARSQRRI